MKTANFPAWKHLLMILLALLSSSFVMALLTAHMALMNLQTVQEVKVFLWYAIIYGFHSHSECLTPGEVRLVNGDRADGNEGRVDR